jgi:hypothetical protein
MTGKRRGSLFAVWAGAHLLQMGLAFVVASACADREPLSWLWAIPCLFPVWVAEVTIFFTSSARAVKVLFYGVTLVTQAVAFAAGGMIYVIRVQPW